MTSKFITNQDENRLLKDVINNILPNTEKFYSLVGYFYFSGFFEIADQVKDKKMFILVGMDVERNLGKVIKEVDRINGKNNSNQTIKKDYYNSIVDLFSHSDIFEGSEKEKAFRVFIEKIKDGTLEIRKTKEPNHAKLYVFEKENADSEHKEDPGISITGSSNLTFSGIKDRYEINVKSNDPEDFKVSKEMFLELWEDAVTIADKDNIDEFISEVVEKIWIDKLPKPYLVYVRVLHELFSIPDKKINLPKGVLDLEYQKDAIKLGLKTIEKHDGVIIADVVGLGKSIVASVIAKNLNLQTIIICPPHLKNQWNDYGKRFKFNHTIYGSGSIEKALKEFQGIDGEKLIIVDEAHKYKNDNTEAYENLKKLCSGNKVMLLTATPFNNEPQDIFSLISLFQIPAKSTIRTVDNLSNRFKELIAEYKKIKKIEDKEERRMEIEKVAEKIRDIIFDLVIRRSRIDLEKNKRYKKDLERQNIAFSKVEPPSLLKYSLGELEDKYIETLDKIINEDAGFSGARYQSTGYIKKDKRDKYEKELEKLFKEKGNLLELTQKNLAKFMRRLLVHRFESSIAAFESTVNNMINSMKLVEDWYEKVGVVPIFKKGNLIDAKTIIDNIEDDSSDTSEELRKIDEDLEKIKKEKGYYYIKKEDLEESFIENLKSDIKLLKEIKKEWEDEIRAKEKDPKINKLKEAIQERLKENPERKIVIFSSYSDTVDYVYRRISDDFKTFKYTSKDSSQENKEIIRKNFDAGIPEEDQRDEFEVLVASDAISEGFNLHRAGIVINYDIPYNPTRVIQRVGRINRINKKVFDNLHIFNFFPTLIGEVETNLKKLSTLKIEMINSLLGTDTQTLTDEEKVESFYREQYQQAESEDERESWETQYQQALSEIPKDVIEKAINERYIPFRTKIKRTEEKQRSGVLVFAKKDTDYVFKFAGKDQEPEILSRKEAIELIEASESEEAEKVSKEFDSVYEELNKNLFNGDTKLTTNKPEQELSDKIEKMQEDFPKEEDYLDDLFSVAINLRGLSGYSERMIRNLDLNEKDAIKNLKEQITSDYLSSQIEKANEIEEGEEALILAEELK